MTAGRIAAILFAVLVVASVAVLAATQSVRNRLVVDQVEITNDLDPRAGRPVRIRFRLTEDEERATLAVIRAGEVVDTLAQDEPLGDYEIHRFRWRVDPELEPGPYRVRLTLESLDREVLLPEVVDVRNVDG